MKLPKILPLKRILAGLCTAMAPLAASAQVAIESFTIDGGGGTSSGGAFTLEGTIGQSDASSPLTGGPFALNGGFWPEALSGYAVFASTFPPGSDVAFDGDANGDGFPNGLTYIFGDGGIEMLEAGVLTAPLEPVPSDVDLFLITSLDLLNWTSLLDYLGGVQTFIDPRITIDFPGGTVTDSGGPFPKSFYQYAAFLAP